MTSSELYSLSSIAECDLYDSSKASKLRIPNIQRGLVWKPIQIELLWDSILRGFPIGSMLVLSHEDGSPDEILDGQQRANAILCGFDDKSLLTDDGPKSILWYDLGFSPDSDKDDNRRIHHICLTNTAHPWGFSPDGSKLSADDRRDAINAAYGEEAPARKSEWDIRRFLPFSFSKQHNFLPIPLSFLVNAAKGKSLTPDERIPSSFIQAVIKYANEFSVHSEWWAQSYKDRVIRFLEKNSDTQLFLPFFDLYEYSIPFNYVTTKDDIEILFNRVNRMGTPMSPEDLTYAAIKHYGSSLCACDHISKVIKEAGEGLIPEASLANIVFRYGFSVDSLRGELNAGDVRKCSNDAVIKRLRSLFSNNSLQTLMRQVKDCLLGNDIPPFLLGEIGKKNPGLFVLLLFLVDKHSDLGTDFIRALVFYLYCFTTKPQPISLVFEAVEADACNPDVLKDSIRNILRDSISHEWAYELPNSFNIIPADKDASHDTSWTIWKYSSEFGFDAFRLLFEYETYQGAFMLKYALRKYFNQTFGEYSSSNKDLWEDINRPWDHDHIIPKSWADDSGNWKQCFLSWLNSWGNIADIPFEENRNKNKYADWSYYDSLNGNPLWAAASYKPYNTPENIEGIKKGIDSYIGEFIQNTWNRFIKISDEFLSLFKVLELSENLSPMQEERQLFLSMLKEKLESYEDGSEYGIYYRTPSGVEIQFNPSDFWSWQKPWLSVIEKSDSTWRNAISVYILHDNAKSMQYIIERGNRKDPDKTPENGGWWENGTFANSYVLKRPLKRLIDKSLNDIDSLPKYFSLGSFILSNNSSDSRPRTGFVLNGYTFISFSAIVDGSLTSISLSWPYYGYFYLVIRPVNQKERLPKKVLQYGEERRFKGNDSYLELYIKEKNDIKLILDRYYEAVCDFLDNLS